MSDKSEYETAYFLARALGSHCALDVDKIIDLLTGWAWDEEEAHHIKHVAAANLCYSGSKKLQRTQAETLVTFKLPSDLLKQIKELAKKQNISVTDVFKRGLQTDVFLSEEEGLGGKVLIEKTNGRMTQLIRPR